jgi:hypothetical protein
MLVSTQSNSNGGAQGCSLALFAQLCVRLHSEQTAAHRVPACEPRPRRGASSAFLLLRALGGLVRKVADSGPSLPIFTSPCLS